MVEHFPDPSVRKSIEVDVARIDQYDALVTDLELTIVREAKRHDADAFHRLRSVPGIGNVLALTILYEIHDVTRFDRVQEFASYARLVKCAHQSAGKKLGTGGAKMGNVHLKWAFSEAAVLFLRHTKDGKKILAGLTKKHGKGKALSILAHKIGRVVFYMLSIGVGSPPSSGWKPALETKTALTGDAAIRRLSLTVACLLDSTTGRRRTTHLTGGGLTCVYPVQDQSAKSGPCLRALARKDRLVINGSDDRSP